MFPATLVLSFVSVTLVALASKVDEPVADPLGLKEVDLRIYQKTLVEDDSSAVVVSVLKDCHAVAFFSELRTWHTRTHGNINQ